MRFTSDPKKQAWTLATRGIDMDRAALIFAGPTVEREDARFTYPEIRINAVGEIDGVFYHLTYTQRGADVLHIISARLASRKERLLWLTRNPRP